MADVTTTAIGLAAGGEEGNDMIGNLTPLGLTILLIAKLMINRGLADHPASLKFHEGIGWAGALNNAILIAR